MEDPAAYQSGGARPPGAQPDNQDGARTIEGRGHAGSGLGSGRRAHHAALPGNSQEGMGACQTGSMTSSSSSRSVWIAAGIEIVAQQASGRTMAENATLGTVDGMRMAIELGRAALTAAPSAQA